MAKHDITEIMEDLALILGAGFPDGPTDDEQVPRVLEFLREHFEDAAFPDGEITPERAAWFLDYARQGLPANVFRGNTVYWNRFARHLYAQDNDLSVLAKRFEEDFSNLNPIEIDLTQAHKVLDDLRYEFQPTPLLDEAIIQNFPQKLWDKIRNDQQEAFNDDRVDWDKFIRGVFRATSEIELKAHEEATEIVDQLKEQFPDTIRSQDVDKQLAREMLQPLRERFKDLLSDDDEQWIFDGLKHCSASGELNWRQFIVAICLEDRRLTLFKQIYYSQVKGD